MFRIAALTVLTVVLAAVAAIVMFAKLLTPDRLTPLFEAYTTARLNARVSAACVELGISAEYPFFKLRVDSLTILSADMLALPERERAMLPPGADTIASADKVEAVIKLPLFTSDGVALRKVKIDNLYLRPVKLREGLANYHIYRQRADKTVDFEFDSLRMYGGCRVEYRDVSRADSIVYVLPDTVMSEKEIESLASRLVTELYMRRMFHFVKNDIKNYDDE